MLSCYSADKNFTQGGKELHKAIGWYILGSIFTKTTTTMNEICNGERLEAEMQGQCKGSAGVLMFSTNFNHRICFHNKEGSLYLCFVYM